MKVSTGYFGMACLAKLAVVLRLCALDNTPIAAGHDAKLAHGLLNRLGGKAVRRSGEWGKQTAHGFYL